jgi:hypothetical protein
MRSRSFRAGNQIVVSLLNRVQRRAISFTLPEYSCCDPTHLLFRCVPVHTAATIAINAVSGFIAGARRHRLDGAQFSRPRWVALDPSSRDTSRSMGVGVRE